MHVCVTHVTSIHVYNFTSSHELSIVFSQLSRARRGSKPIGAASEKSADRHQHVLVAGERGAGRPAVCDQRSRGRLRWADGINVPLILERTPGRTEMNAPLFDLNYGLPNVQAFCPKQYSL